MSAAAAPVSSDGQQPDTNHAWEASTNQWENAVREDADGRIIVAGGDTTADIIRKRRKRLEQNDYAQRNRRVVRDMIRYVYVLIDCSRWALQKDPVLGGTKLEVSTPEVGRATRETPSSIRLHVPRSVDEEMLKASFTG